MSSLFDTLKNHLGSLLHHASPEEAAAASNPGFAAGVIDLLQKQGMAAIVEKFKQAGLADVVQSWISKGENLPITADMLHKVLGPDAIEALAQKAGLPPGQATALLAKLLPGMVDKLTPNGLLEEPTTTP